MTRAVVRPVLPEAVLKAKNAWRCRACGEVLTTWAGAQRHANGHGGARLDGMWDGVRIAR